MADSEIQDYNYPNIEPIDYIDESLDKIKARDDSAKHGFRRTQTLPIVSEEDVGMEVYLVGDGTYKLISYEAGEPNWKKISDVNRNPAYNDWVQGNFQPVSDILSSLARLTGVSNAVIYFNGPNDVQASPATPTGLAILAGNDAQSIRESLNLGDVAVMNLPIDGRYIADGTLPQTKIDAAFANNMGFSTGDVKLTYKTTADTGWVFADDGSIGNLGSGATTRANADTEALFRLMWNIPECTLQTYAGAASSKTTATQDWQALKRLVLPKTLGRVLGVAGQGAGLTGRNLGASVGVEHVALTVNQMPAHWHSLRGQVPVYSPYATGHYTFHRDGQSLYRKGEEPDVSMGIAGGNEAHTNMQPSSFLNLMIKL